MFRDLRSLNSSSRECKRSGTTYAPTAEKRKQLIATCSSGHSSVRNVLGSIRNTFHSLRATSNLSRESATTTSRLRACNSEATKSSTLSCQNTVRELPKSKLSIVDPLPNSTRKGYAHRRVICRSICNNLQRI